MTLKLDTGTTEIRCRFCAEELRHTFADLGTSPLADSYPEPAHLHRMQHYFPLRAHVCARCYLVQIQDVPRPPDFAGPVDAAGSYTACFELSEQSLEQAQTDTNASIERFELHINSQVIELGSRDGAALQHYRKRGIPVLGIEPAARAADAAIRAGIPTRVRSFSRDMALQLADEGLCADIIIGNNVLAHVTQVNDFVHGLKILLKPSGVITMEFPHLMRMMAETQFDNIGHEHFSYFSLLTIVAIFAAHALTIYDIEETMAHGGSLRIFARHAENDRLRITSSVTEMLNWEELTGLARLDHYLGFESQIEGLKRSLLAFLIAVKGYGKRIAAYGAPAKAITLLNYCGIKSDFIDYTVDPCPERQGRFLPGTSIPIVHPDKITKTKPDYLLILPWNTKDDVMRKMGHLRDWGGQFIVPIPRVRVYP